eukprot:SAG11_NODE_1072_length_5974_cov_1.634553_2_plen_72_part_00
MQHARALIQQGDGTEDHIEAMIQRAHTGVQLGSVADQKTKEELAVATEEITRLRYTLYEEFGYKDLAVISL